MPPDDVNFEEVLHKANETRKRAEELLARAKRLACEIESRVKLLLTREETVQEPRNKA